MFTAETQSAQRRANICNFESDVFVILILLQGFSYVTVFIDIYVSRRIILT